MEASCSLSKSTSTSTTTCSDDDGLSELRRGPWTAEEDSLLVHYISCHGEGRWNLLAKRSGLKRTGKSCRLRWLNYLKPDVKRGNLSPEEQLLILELHSKWGNRWSKIAQYLPGRTDNEIKNYWRTRVQKQARHLKIDANSTEFQELIRTVWMPRLLQKVQGTNPFPDDDSSPAATTAPLGLQNHQMLNAAMENNNMSGSPPPPRMSYSENPIYPSANNFYSQFQNEYYNIDTDSILDMESFNSSAAAPGTRVGGSTGPTNYSSDQTNWRQISDDMGHGFWNNLDEFWQVKQAKERYT